MRHCASFLLPLVWVLAASAGGVLGSAVTVQADLIFPYEFVSAFGRNNERDAAPEACDLELGCYDKDGYLCSADPRSL